MAVQGEEGLVPGRGAAQGGSSWWAKLRRRKVVQWGIAYVAGAWGLLQGLAYLRETFDWPQPMQQAATVLLLFGLPIALVVAWYHGDRGHQRVTRTELVLLAALFVAGGVVFGWHATRDRDALDAVARVEPGGEARVQDTRPSIAVLPFENRSANEDDVHFVDGIHDDILTQLSRIGALKVISRTSVERFRDTRLPVSEIAAQLGVTSILEGGVQRAGDRVRINVQLIDARTDAHLWGESYDRELSAVDLFAIQREVASTIAAALKATLTESERAGIAVVPTSNFEAWESYQLGRQRLAKRTSEGLAEAEDHFSRAAALDPQFAAAFVGLADALALRGTYGGLPMRVQLAKADRAIETALRLAPSQSDALKTAGYIAYSRGEYQKSEVLFRRAIEAAPNDARARHWYSLTLRDLGRYEEAIAQGKLALELDPLSAVAAESLGSIYAWAGRFRDAERQYFKSAGIDPLRPGAYSQLALLYAYALNRFAEAVPLMERAQSLDPGSPLYTRTLAMILVDLGSITEASRLLKAGQERWPVDTELKAMTAVLQLFGGDEAGARRTLELAARTDPSCWICESLLAEIDVRSGRYQDALGRYRNLAPELFGTGAPQVEASNFFLAIAIAAALLKSGEPERASALLDASERAIEPMQRMEIGGYGLADVQILALRGQGGRALARLRQAVDDGWRGPYWKYALALDSALAPIRDEPEFVTILAAIESDMARQREALAARSAVALDGPTVPGR